MTRIFLLALFAIGCGEPSRVPMRAYSEAGTDAGEPTGTVELGPITILEPYEVDKCFLIEWVIARHTKCKPPKHKEHEKECREVLEWEKTRTEIPCPDGGK